MTDGTLFYVVGPSGSGKDSLLRYARAHLAGDPEVVFAHRYITRPVELHGENHVTLTEAEFDARLGAGLFAMHWESHGLRYGIGLEIHLWLARGCHVVVNGSRAYLQQARNRYPELAAVWVEVSADVLEARLRARGGRMPRRSSRGWRGRRNSGRMATTHMWSATTAPWNRAENNCLT